jgi:SAM-dependent methyltransferase
MNSPRLARLFFEHDGKLTDKWEQYLGIYQGEMERFIAAGKPVRLLEIGVQNGGSLEVWSKFFPPGSAITGIDIEPAVADLKFAGNVRAFVADVNDMEKVEGCIGTGPFDIIIDDGSHTSPDVIAAFKYLFSKLAPGGKYFAEDLHCSYWKSHQGGFRLGSSSIEYFKDVVDALNADHFEASDCLSAAAKIELPDLSRQIARISFYDSVVVIEKLMAEKQRPYRHLLSGQETSVNDPADFIAAAPSELISPWLVGDAAARSIDIKLKEDLQRSRQEIETMRQDRTRLEYEMAVTAAEYESKLLQVRSELDAILRSRAWRATALVRKAAGLIRKRS